ncbi:MAG: hypothetical protein JNN04_14000 [Cyclobacteriaceae bacterium]|nr:hypothetical protein [Cyclobacteriaceae bacterium]
MKTRIHFFILLFLVVSVAALAQKGGPPQKGNSQGGSSQGTGNDCFKEWYSLIRERGAAEVTDGTHEIIITLRNTQEGTSKCYMGKVDVRNGKLTRPILVQKEDGTYEPLASTGKGLDPAFARSMSEEELATIADGMSVNFNISGGEFCRIFFYTFINPKPKGLKQAPSAKTLVKN